MSVLTRPRQVRLLKCAILSPGLSSRASSAEDAATLASYGFSVMPFVQRIDIYESIFDNTISGRITLLENIGLVEYLPIVGVETLAVAFEVEDSNGDTKLFARSFRISKVHNQSFPRHDFRLYTMEFVTHEFVLSVGSRICRPYKQVTCTQAVRSILTQDLGLSPTSRPKLITQEETYDKIDVVIPNYTPLKAINHFAILAQTTDTKESNFLFFETLDGFHFTSIRKLIQDAPATLPVFAANPGRMSGETVEDAIARNSALRIHQDQSFDLLQDIAGGTLRSRMVHFDILARQLKYEDGSRYSDTFKKTTHLDAHPLYPENFDLSVGKDVRLFTVPSNFWSVKSSYAKSKGELLIEQRLREAIILRNRQLREIRHLQTLIDLPGRPELRAGSVVIVNYPSSRTLERKDVSINVPTWAEATPYYSGKHLVTSVHHILASQGNDAMEYRMNVRVCKDSLGSPLIGSSNKTGA